MPTHKSKSVEENEVNEEQSISSELHHHKKNKTKLIVIPVTILILAVAGVLAWLYTGELTDAKMKVFSQVPLPAAKVGSKFLTVKELVRHIELAKKIPAAEGQDQGAIRDQLFTQLVENKKLESIAQDRGVTADGSEIDRDYKALINEYAGGDEGKLNEQLQSTYGLTSNDFKNEVVKLDVLQSDLAIWHNSQKNLNEDSFKLADELQSKLSNGESFEELARTYSQDDSAEHADGDQGFVEFKRLLPEFQEKLASTKANDITLVVSRYGLHIMKTVERNQSEESGDMIHLSQIFLQQNDFFEWYTKEAENVPVKKFLKI